MERQALDERLWEMRVSMLRLAYSILRHPQDAEDAVSSAVVTVYQRIGSLRDERAFAPWVLRITANCCYDALRRAKRERALAREEKMAGALFERPEGDSLLETLCALPPPLSQVLELYYYENFSTREIARALGLPEGTVRVRLSRGRRRLKDMLEKEEQP